jgi:hypothetical protein
MHTLALAKKERLTQNPCPEKNCLFKITVKKATDLLPSTINVENEPIGY